MGQICSKPPDEYRVKLYITPLYVDKQIVSDEQLNKFINSKRWLSELKYALDEIKGIQQVVVKGKIVIKGTVSRKDTTKFGSIRKGGKKRDFKNGVIAMFHESVHAGDPLTIENIEIIKFQFKFEFFDEMNK